MYADADQVGWNLFVDRAKPTAVQALCIMLHGLGLFVGPADPTARLRDCRITAEGVDWSKAQLTYRPNAMYLSTRRNRWPENTSVGITVEFTW